MSTKNLKIQIKKYIVFEGLSLKDRPSTIHLQKKKMMVLRKGTHSQAIEYIEMIK